MKRHNLRSLVIATLAAGFVFLPACGKKRRTVQIPATVPPSTAASRRPAPNPSSTRGPLKVGYVEEGVASWYGVPYHGRPAADGEIYDMETLVAAHRLMPFNTWLRVTNLANGRTVNVRVIDRGPFVAGRFLDLSKAAARQIDLIGPGTGQVRVEVISAPSDVPSNDFYAVQIGAFSVYANAERARIAYAERFGTAQLALKQGAVPLWRVLVGKEKTIGRAQQLADQLRVEDNSVFVVRLDETVPNAPVPNPPIPAAMPPAAALARTP